MAAHHPPLKLSIDGCHCRKADVAQGLILRPTASARVCQACTGGERDRAQLWMRIRTEGLKQSCARVCGGQRGPGCTGYVGEQGVATAAKKLHGRLVLKRGLPAAMLEGGALSFCELLPACTRLYVSSGHKPVSLAAHPRLYLPNLLAPASLHHAFCLH